MTRVACRFICPLSLALLASLAALASLASLSAAVAQSAEWKDSSPHRTQLVQVSAGVRVEVLDWGGTGRPLVLLAGGGDTSHVFDDFAPKLTDSFHVYGITRRGFGASEFSEAEAGPDRFGDDLLAVLDALEMKGPVLVGHSFGGAEMSSIASRYPTRAAALIYLDAAYAYAFDNGSVPTLDDFLKIRPPQPPPPGDADRVSFDTMRQYYERTLGFTYPEAELRHRFTAEPDGRVGKRRAAPGMPTLLSNMKKYARIPAPALMIFARPHGLGRWVDTTSDENVREQAGAYGAAIMALTDRQLEAIKSSLPSARVVTLPGANHYVYLSHEADVLREMRAFLSQIR